MQSTRLMPSNHCAMPRPAPDAALQIINGEPMKQRAFTLVEMLVVIAIAAIILALTLTIAHGVIKMVRSFQG